MGAAGYGVVGLAQSLPRPAVIPVTIAGFTVVGLGLSVASPITTQYSARTIKGMTTASAIATVDAVSLVGRLIGPPFVGGLAMGLDGLRWPFVILGGLVLLIAFITLKLPASTAKQEKNAVNESNRDNLPCCVETAQTNGTRRDVDYADAGAW